MLFDDIWSSKLLANFYTVEEALHKLIVCQQSGRCSIGSPVGAEVWLRERILAIVLSPDDPYVPGTKFLGLNGWNCKTFIKVFAYSFSAQITFRVLQGILCDHNDLARCLSVLYWRQWRILRRPHSLVIIALLSWVPLRDCIIHIVWLSLHACMTPPFMLDCSRLFQIFWFFNGCYHFSSFALPNIFDWVIQTASFSGVVDRRVTAFPPSKYFTVWSSIFNGITSMFCTTKSRSDSYSTASYKTVQIHIWGLRISHCMAILRASSIWFGPYTAISNVAWHFVSGVARSRIFCAILRL